MSNDKRFKRVSLIREPEAGFFSIEMIMVLIIALTLLAASAGRIASLFSTSSSADMLNTVLQLQSRVRGLRTLSGYGSDGDELSEMLVRSSSVPSGVFVRDMKLYNEWQGVILVRVLNSGMGFVIEYPKVPAEVAAQILPKLLANRNFTAIEIDGAILNEDTTSQQISESIAKASTGGGLILQLYTDSSPSEG